MFKYLESTLIANGQTKDEIRTQITAVRNAFFRMTEPLWNHREFTINLYSRDSFDLAIRLYARHGQ